MNLDERLEELKKAHAKDVEYYNRILDEKDKCERRMLKLEGGINVVTALIEDEKNKLSAKPEPSAGKKK